MTAGFYHCSVKAVGRSNGRSIVAAAAYRAGERLTDERTGEIADYRARGGVAETFVLARDDASPRAQDIGRLWNDAERAEPRANGRIATEIVLGLPHELDAAIQKQLLKDYLAPIIEKHGVAAQVSIHAPDKDGDHRNWHAHVLITHREYGADGFGDIANTRTTTRMRKGREVQEQVAGIAATPADITALRKQWEQTVNRAYERAGLDIRVDHRSHEDRGLDQEPTQHLGPTATAIERRGETSDRGAVNREITARNADRQHVPALEAEVKQLSAQVMDVKADFAMREAHEGAKGRYDRVNVTHRDGARGGPSGGPENRPEPEDMRPLGKTAADIRTAWALSRTPGQLDEALAARGIALAQVSAEEARQSQMTAAFAKEIGNFARVLKEGEIVAVNEYGNVHRLDQRTTGDLRPEIEARLAGINHAGLLGVAETKEAMQEAARATWRDEAREWRDMNVPPTGIEATIADALANTMTGVEFAAALDAAGLTVARATGGDVIALDALRHEAALAATVAHTEDVNLDRRARHFANLAEGDYAAVTRNGDVFRLNPTTLDFEEAEQRLADTQPRLPSVIEARALNEISREKTADFWAELHAENLEARTARNDAFEGDQALHRTGAAGERAVENTFDAAAAAVGVGSHAASGLLDGLDKAVESVLGGLLSFGAAEPKLTPLQAELAARAAEELAEARAQTRAAHEKDAAQDSLLSEQRKQQQQEELDRKMGYRDDGRERERDLGRDR